MVGHWPSRNSSLGVEMRFTDRLLVSNDGVVNRRGSLLGIKKLIWISGLLSELFAYTCQPRIVGVILKPRTWQGP